MSLIPGYSVTPRQYDCMSRWNVSDFEKGYESDLVTLLRKSPNGHDPGPLADETQMIGKK